MREVVCINLGQCGIQMANAAWELFCIEHGITADGKMRGELNDTDSKAFGTFFYPSPSGQYVPRVITADLEPTVIDEIRTGSYRQLFHPDALISGEEDAASNFARGHFTIGKSIIEPSMTQLRRVVENCERLEGFLIFSSYGGGTGSGFQTLVLEKLNIEFAKRIKTSFTVYPCYKMSSSTVEPYNAVLTTHFTMEQIDLAILYDNESAYSICANTLDIARPTFSNLNRLIAQIYSSITVSLRYESSLNADLDQLMTNLIPYPRIHYCMVNHSPILSQHRAIHEQLTTIELTRNMFDTANNMVEVNMAEGKYFSCSLQYRGKVTPREVNNAVFDIKRRTDIKFVDWCPTGFKVGINSQPPAFVPNSGLANSLRSVTMITNNSSITQLFDKINKKFNLLFNKRAFVHWYVGEGMEEGEFNEARDNSLFLIKDYNEILGDENEGDDELPTAQDGGVPMTEGSTDPLVADQMYADSPLEVKQTSEYRETDLEQQNYEDADVAELMQTTPSENEPY